MSYHTDLARDVKAITDLLQRDPKADIMAQAVSVGIAARAGRTAGNFAIGDAARCVAKRYRANSISNFAGQIGVSLDRVREYRTVAAFWDLENSARAAFLENDLADYTHFRLAKRLKDVQKAEDALLYALQSNMTPERFELYIKERLHEPVPARKDLILNTLVCVTDIFQEPDGSIVLTIRPEEINDKLIKAQAVGRVLQMNLYTAPEQSS